MAAAAAAALGLGDEVDKEIEEALAAGGDPEDPAGWEEEDNDDPPLNEEAIDGLKTEFHNSLVRVFGYTELSASVIQDNLGLNEMVDLLHGLFFSNVEACLHHQPCLASQPTVKQAR
jgi:hypothetical protein